MTSLKDNRSQRVPCGAHHIVISPWGLTPPAPSRAIHGDPGAPIDPAERHHPALATGDPAPIGDPVTTNAWEAVLRSRLLFLRPGPPATSLRPPTHRSPAASPSVTRRGCQLPTLAVMSNAPKTDADITPKPEAGPPPTPPHPPPDTVSFAPTAHERSIPWTTTTRSKTPPSP